MRLSEDQIERGLLHADKNVRFACLGYFADCFSRNRKVMPVVIEALEHFGRADAFTYTHPVAGLAQTEETIRWVVGELNDRPRNTDPERNYAKSLGRLLCHADPTLLLPHEKAILGSPGFSPEFVKPFTYGLELSTWAGDALWRELETICEEGRDKVYTRDVRYHEAKQIVEALAREGERHAERMMSLLRTEVGDYEDDPMKWMESLVVSLAGGLRHEPAVPLIVGKLHREGEVSSEECHCALVKIGTDSVVRTILRDYPTAGGHFRLYAPGVLGHIHTDLAVAACIQLLGEERDLEQQNWLAQSLVGHFSHEGNEVARGVLLEDSYLFDLKCALVPACTLTGQDFPELDQWRKEIEETMKPKPLPQRPVPQTPPTKIPSAVPPSRLRPVTVKQKAGRNDPCPCGSGKKYKKCCMDK
jgi:SEC-C motif